MLALVPFFISILFNFHGIITVVNSLNDEGTSLLSFKQSIKLDPENSLANWNNSDQTPCSWNGITCKQQRVVAISIPNKKLSGFLSPSLGSLSELRHVNLRSNSFYGVLTSQFFAAQKLQSLVLYGNSLSGPLPFEVGKLQYLHTLDLSNNFFNGSLPSSLVHCKRLRNLDLGKNNFTGSLPDNFGKNLALLEKLDLSYNEFSGSIPNDFGYLTNLQGTVDLSHNMFNGSIPASLGNLPEKVYIDVTYNRLSGPIPQSGALVNRGPTAFIGNPNLCGSPLKNPCNSTNSIAASPSSFPYVPKINPPLAGENAGKGGGGLSKVDIVAIVVSDVVGICLIGLLFSCCYSRIRSCRERKVAKGDTGGKELCLCFGKDNESETLFENEERHDLVPLDGVLSFDLDELLKASAFVLGKSGVGIVYKVVLDDGLTLVVRRLGEGGSQRFKEFQTEVEAIGKIRHRNIVALRAYYWSVDEKLLIYAFAPNGNLATAIHGKAGVATFNPLSWSTRFKIIKGIAKGLVYLHEYSPKKYVHGNLKPSNILLGHDMEPKISDFGLGRLANIATGPSMVQPVGPDYRAPEAMKEARKPSQKWDVYSYGVMMLEMLTGRSPLVRVGNSEMDLGRWMQLCIEEKKPLSGVLDPHLDVNDEKEEEEVIAVLKVAMACVHGNPDRRPSMRYVADSLERLPLSSD